MSIINDLTSKENPNMKKMCEMCYKKQECDSTKTDQLLCKMNQINTNLSNLMRIVNELNIKIGMKEE